MTYGAPGSVKVVRRICSMHTYLVRGCFDNPAGLNIEYLPRRHDFRVYELASGLRLGTAMLSQDLSELWITMHG
jgi:hypothetical protein